jgi:lysophospholipase L1-like esterase
MPEHMAHLQRLEPFVELVRSGRPSLAVAFGDSNTCNTNFTRGAKQWPELLHTMLCNHFQTLQIRLVNSGVSGDCVRRALARWEVDVARFRPDLLIVAFGSNDANRLGDDEFESGLRQICRRGRGAGAAVLLRTVTPLMEYEPAPPHLWADDERLRAKIEITRRVAAEEDVAFADVYADWWAREERGELAVAELMADAVHTNAAGHRQVARSLAPAFGLAPTFAWEQAG